MIAPVVGAVPPGAVVADVRWPAGREAYERGHLPGAVYVDLDTVLAAPPTLGEGRHPLPSPEVFASGMAACGIGDDTTVVAYDDAGGVVAARLVWLLRALGHDAALLDGALEAPLETGPVLPAPAVFTPRPWPTDRLAGLAEVLDPSLVVLDARDGERFRGDVEPLDPRAGHVPGARSLPCRELVADGRLLPVDQLRTRFAEVGVIEGSDVVAYCGSGVTACHDLLAMEHAGLGPGRLYPGSWSAYCSDPERPVATGP